MFGDYRCEIFQGAIRIVRCLEKLLHRLRVDMKLFRISDYLRNLLFANAQLGPENDADGTDELARFDGGFKIHVG